MNEKREMNWRSVSSGIPPEGTVCAVLLRDGSILTAWPSYWHGACTDFNCWTFPHPDDSDCTEDVTHWIELPEPPAKEKQC